MNDASESIAEVSWEIFSTSLSAVVVILVSAFVASSAGGSARSSGD